VAGPDGTGTLADGPAGGPGTTTDELGTLGTPVPIGAAEVEVSGQMLV